jgi:hypothetical protein
MTPQPQFTSGTFFYFSPERKKGDSVELIIIKQAYPYPLILFELQRSSGKIQQDLPASSLSLSFFISMWAGIVLPVSSGQWRKNLYLFPFFPFALDCLRKLS